MKTAVYSEYTTDVIITRGVSIFWPYDDIEIYIDGQKKGTVGDGETIEIIVLNGEHKISTKAGNEIQFTAKGGKIMFAFDDKSKELVFAGEPSSSEQTYAEIIDIIADSPIFYFSSSRPIKFLKEKRAGKKKLIIYIYIYICTVIAISFILTCLSIVTRTGLKEEDIFIDMRDHELYFVEKIGEQAWLTKNLSYNAEGSECYDNKPENCKKYGRLYNWETAMKSCPDGWHLPSNEELDKLFRFTGGIKKNTCSAGDCGIWWSATDYGSFRAYGRAMYRNTDYAGLSHYDKTELLSVRCLRD